MTTHLLVKLPLVALAALAVSAPSAWAQRPPPIRISPVAPAPATQPATNPQLQMPQGTITSAADPLELLKQVNILRGQVAQLQKQMADLQAGNASLQNQQTTQAKTLQGLQNGLATVSLKGVGNTNDIVSNANAAASMNAAQKADLAALKSAFDNHKHYQKLAHIVNDQQKIDLLPTSEPTLYCKKSNNGGLICNPPQ